MATKIGFRCQIDNITHAEIINYLNINCSIMSPKERGVMKEPLLDMVWNEDEGIMLLVVWTFQILVLSLRFWGFYHGFMALSCNVPHPRIIISIHEFTVSCGRSSCVLVSLYFLL